MRSRLHGRRSPGRRPNELDRQLFDDGRTSRGARTQGSSESSRAGPRDATMKRPLPYPRREAGQERRPVAGATAEDHGPGAGRACRASRGARTQGSSKSSRGGGPASNSEAAPSLPEARSRTRAKGWSWEPQRRITDQERGERGRASRGARTQGSSKSSRGGGPASNSEAAPSLPKARSRTRAEGWSWSHSGGSRTRSGASGVAPRAEPGRRAPLNHRGEGAPRPQPMKQCVGSRQEARPLAPLPRADSHWLLS